MDFYDLTPPRPPQRPAILDAPGPITTGGLIGGLLLWAFMTGAAGTILGIIFVVAAGAGPAHSEAQNNGLVMGYVLAGIIMGVIALMMTQADFGPAYEQRRAAKAQYKAEYARYERLRAEWPAELERRQIANYKERQRRGAEERRRQRIRDIVKAVLLQKQKEEAERKRLAAEAAARLKAWEDALEWAKATLEQEYHGLAIKLAAAHGRLDDNDVLKVFVTAYPHMTCSTDWRMGCLRELAENDQRVAAILPFLQPSDAKNRRPS